MPSQDFPYYLLCQLTHEPAASLRGLAERFWASFAKLNHRLSVLGEKGLFEVDDLRRSDNKLAYSYVPRLAGLDEKGRLTRTFLARKRLEFKVPQQEIEQLRQEAGQP